jgi:periplasmic protein TonB
MKNMIKILILISFILGVLHSTAQQTLDSSKPLIAAPVEEVFYSVQQLPQFKGSFVQYLSSNLEYPKTALKSRTQGTIYIKFVVDTKGKIEQIQVDEKSSTNHKDLIEEAKRVLSKSSGDWIPAKHKGKNVKIHMRQSIQFSLVE